MAKFNNCIFVLPKETILDELGILFFDSNKFVEIQTIVVNGLPSCLIVYVGSSNFVHFNQ